MTRVTHRTLVTVVIAVGVAALLAMIALWPGEQPPVEENPAQQTEVYDATLVSVAEVPDANTQGLTPGAITVAVRARIDATGEEVAFETTDETGDLYRTGQKVRLAAITQDDLGTTYFITDFRRGGPLILLAALFVAAVVWFGRLQGVRALLGLAVTFLIIVGFMIPALLEGRSPLLVAVVGAALVMIATLYLSHGVSPKTTAAVVGTCMALIVTGLLAVAFVSLANITGFSSEEARMANVQVGGISVRGLLLAGIVIGGLGVLDDVTMSQASTVFQLHRANPQARFRELVSSALAVGRDHIAATINTLFLAYAGASLPLLILFATSPDALSGVLTSETVATEVVRTLVGSIGLIAAVPFTTALAAGLVLGGPDSNHRVRDAAAAQAQQPESEPHVDTSIPNYSDEMPSDAEWERRLREAYRIPPEEEQ